MAVAVGNQYTFYPTCNFIRTFVHQTYKTIMKFEDFRVDEQIKKNLSKIGFKKPTDIQYKSIPSIL